MQREPLLTVAGLTAAATAILSALVAFGLDLSTDQTAALMGLVAVAAPLIVAAATRSRVTPVDKSGPTPE